MKFLEWKRDKWNSTQGSYLKYDKLEHLLLGFIGLLATLIFIPAGIWIDLGFWILIGTTWEIIDGTFTYDGIHIQGFSWKDLIADCFGFILAIIVYSIYINLLTY